MRRPLVAIAAVICCLLASAPAVALVGNAAGHVGTPGTARATHATFAGQWYGHTRGLTISRRGLAKESVGDGCCDPIINLRFRISHIRGTTHKASARATVTRVRVKDKRAFSPSHPGEVRRLRLRHGVIHEPFVHTDYCDMAADLRGVCGA